MPQSNQGDLYKAYQELKKQVELSQPQLQPAPKVHPYKAVIENDIDVVLAACLPTFWTPEAPTPEPKLALGCVHPMEKIKVSTTSEDLGGRPSWFCVGCDHYLEPRLVTLRYEQWVNERRA